MLLIFYHCHSSRPHKSVQPVLIPLLTSSTVLYILTVNLGNASWEIETHCVIRLSQDKIIFVIVVAVFDKGKTDLSGDWAT